MDHETSNAQEWQLPGYGRSTPKKKAAQTIPSPQTPTPHAAASKPKNEPEPKTQIPPTAPKAPALLTKNAGPPQRAARARSRGSRGRGRYNKGTVHSSQLFQDTSAKSKWRNGAKPDGVVQLPASFGVFKHEFFGAVRTTTFLKKSDGVRGRNEVFEEINKRTNAYVNPPGYTDQVIHIWGEPPQVTAAEEIIRAAIFKCNSFNKVVNKKIADWTKIRAYSENKEANADFKEKRDIVLQQLRGPPGPGFSFSEQLLFLWPKDGPSMNDCLGPQLEYLDLFRARFECHMWSPKDLPGYICAVGQSHEAMKEIAQRLRTLYAESVAKSNVKTKLYLVEPPEPRIMKSEIIVKKEYNLHKPMLQGNPLSSNGLTKWQDRVVLIDSKNRARLQDAIERSLVGIAYVRGHLRMRINLGTFVLDKYAVPEDNMPFYGFEEFREMLLHEQTKGRLIPVLKVDQSNLLKRCFKATHLIERCDGMSSPLRSAELAYSVNFEFTGSDKSMLRLEAEFAKSPGAQDYEITQRRWLRPRTGGHAADQRPPLHVAVTDFGRSDWQLEIKSLDFHDTASINTALKRFSHTIGFQHTENMGDISAEPERKVIFPADAPVSRFIEKTALRYSLKDTDYIFEIARYDEYRRVDLAVHPGQTGTTITGGISKTPFTTWGASIFGTNWDNLLGGHANLPVGQAARYSPSLSTFFPSKESSTEIEDEAKGFWEFIDLVKQAAELLGPTQPSPLKSTGPNTASQAVPSSTEVDPVESAASSSAVSSPTSMTSPAGMLNADLGTLF
ncbi:hypothetical protein BJX68DRAFT_262857 [Aspergillus pseudodeflectus]|uniref:DUF7905 domain-containing protein n=1 Tax=Aspergillus pseudodeflectus TaxID=176178 RepID=A0ABR4L2F4_9EURO